MKPKNKTNALNNSKRHAKKSAKMNKNKLNDANDEIKPAPAEMRVSPSEMNIGH